jgi:predicted CXXCH cytochrome family protein
MNHRIRTGIFLILALVVTASLTAISTLRSTAESGDEVPPLQGVDTDECLACHDTPGLQTELPSGEPLYLTVDSVVFATSTHGRLGYACVQCHENISGFPHDPITADTRRDFTLQLYTSCARCHKGMYDATLDSTHQRSLAAGNPEAAVCTDCHGAHNTGPPDVPRSRIPHTCERCHSEIYNSYEASVHGAALIGDGNPFVPSCIDCHGVHNVEGPSNSPFHLFSPLICAECHDDENLMSRYGISTDVFETYVADFHGTTVILFEALAPDQETNKPVCVDCHGVHSMRKVDDPESTVIKENLLTTCQKCHPDATSNFPTSWLKHYIPSRENTPLVFFVNLFYQILIPGTIGGMLLYVVADGGRRIIQRRQERRHE